MTIHEVFSNSQNDASASAGNRPSPTQRASYLFCQQTGETMVNRGASGATTQDQAYATHTLGARDSTTKVWLLDLLTNDMYARPKTPVGLQWSKDFLTACLAGALFGVKKSARSGAASTIGTWANTQVDSYGQYTLAQNAEKTFDVSGRAVAVCWLADYHTAARGVLEIRIDGVLVDTVNIAIPFGITPNGLRYGPAARIYDAGVSGSHTVNVKCITSGTYAYLSYVAGTGGQASMPKCFVGTGTRCAGVTDAYSELCSQMVIDHAAWLCSLGLPVEAIDTWSVIIPALHMMADGIHWNSAGETAIKDAMVLTSMDPSTIIYDTADGRSFTITFDGRGKITDIVDPDGVTTHYDTA